MKETYVRLFTKFLSWEWYDDANTMRVFLHLLLKAEPRDTRWRGKKIKRGQVAVSIRKLAEELHLSVRNIRTSLGHLQATHEVTQKITQQTTIITICKYDSYNTQVSRSDTASDTVSDTRPTQCRHTTDTPQISQSKEDKEVLEEVVDTSKEQKESGVKKNKLNNNNIIYNNIIQEKEKEKEKESSAEKNLADLKKRQKKFYESLVPFLDEFGKDMLRQFYDYWSEPTRSKKRMKMEIETTWDTHRRLLYWQRREEEYGNKRNTRAKEADRRRGMEVIAKTAEDFGNL